MKRQRSPVKQRVKDDLSFIPPIAEHVNYIELADRFLAESLVAHEPFHLFTTADLSQTRPIPREEHTD